ncbi:hypothetical protein D3C71_1851390 [compost metagenome]
MWASAMLRSRCSCAEAALRSLSTWLEASVSTMARMNSPSTFSRDSLAVRERFFSTFGPMRQSLRSPRQRR